MAEVVTEGFSYLWVFITIDPELFYQCNLSPLLQRLQGDVCHWRTLPLYLLGRAALFNMMALPRSLYILQNTPYPVPTKYFQSIESEQRLLSWGGKPLRMALHKLVRGGTKGVLHYPTYKNTTGWHNWWPSTTVCIDHQTSLLIEWIDMYWAKGEMSKHFTPPPGTYP